MAIPKKKADSKKKEIVYGNAKKRTETHDAGYTPTTYRVPEGVKLFRFKKEGKYRIDVIPFVAKKSNPFAGGEGVVWYERTFYIHKDIGPDNSPYVCLNKTFGKRCPICEHVAKMRRDPRADESAIKALAPKERQLWLFLDQNSPEDGIQLYEASFYMGFGQLIDSKVKASDEEDGYDRFFQLEGGMTVKVLVEQDSFNGRQYYKPVTIDMVARTKDLEESLLEDAPCLDDLLIELPYEKLKQIFLQEEGSNEEVDEEDEEMDEDSDDGDDGDDELDEEDDDDGSGDSAIDDEGDDEETGRDSGKAGKKSKLKFKMKDKVTFKKGKKMVEGIITKINEKNGVALVKVEGESMPIGVNLSELKEVVEDEDTDDEWEDDDADDSELEEIEETDDTGDDDDSDVEDDEDEEWEDDELEEEEPAPKPKKKK